MPGVHGIHGNDNQDVLLEDLSSLVHGETRTRVYLRRLDDKWSQVHCAKSKIGRASCRERV